MTWVAHAAALTAPVLDNWSDPDRVSIQGQDLDPDLLTKSGDPANPRVWLVHDWDVVDAGYLASGGGLSRYIEGEIETWICVEPGPGADDKIRQEADNLETYFAAATGGIFWVNRARLEGPFTWDGQWRRGDWILPFRVNEDLGVIAGGLLAGQSSNQLTREQSAHGFSVGDWIGYNGSSWVKAKAASGSIAADGVVSSVADVDNFTVTTGDIVKLTAHGWTAGKLYLSGSTAGAATSTEPDAGDPRQYLGKALDADYVTVKPDEGAEW